MSSTTNTAGARISRLTGSKRLQGAAVGLAAGSLLTASAAVASSGGVASAPRVIHGCVSKTTRVLTVPRSGSRCPRATGALSWNIAGPRGAIGLAGPSGAPGWGNVISGPRFEFSLPSWITSDGRHLWVSNLSNSTVTEVNASDGSFVRRLSGGSYNISGPYGIAFDGHHG